MFELFIENMLVAFNVTPFIFIFATLCILLLGNYGISLTKNQYSNKIKSNLKNELQTSSYTYMLHYITLVTGLLFAILGLYAIGDTFIEDSEIMKGTDIIITYGERLSVGDIFKYQNDTNNYLVGTYHHFGDSYDTVHILMLNPTLKNIKEQLIQEENNKIKKEIEKSKIINSLRNIGTDEIDNHKKELSK